MIILGILAALLYAAPGGVWLALIGWFLTVAATAEASLVETKQALRGLTVTDAMTPRPDVARADATLGEFMEDDFAQTRHSAYPVVDGERVVGLLSVGAVAAVPRVRWSSELVRDRMEPLDQALVLDEHESLGEALPQLTQSRAGRAIVTVGERPRGLLSLTDVRRLLEFKQLPAR